MNDTMKKFLLSILIIGAALPMYAQFESATLQASGLTCAMCSRAINKSLEALPFVEKVTADIKNSAFQVRFKPTGEVNIDQLKEAVETAGFSVGKLKLQGNFSTVAIRNDEHVTINGNTFHFLNVRDQQLSGERAITVVDKDFVTAREFKKFSAATQMACVKTGKAAGCCKKEGLSANERIYHVTI